MTFFKQFMLAASVGVGTLLMSSSALSASLTFSFSGKLSDGDRFNAVFTTTDTLQTLSFPAHTNPGAGGLTSPAYSFTGYLITGISGGWYEAEDPTTALSITGLKPVGSIIENSLRNDPPGGTDTIAHSFTDNLFDPKDGKWDTLGKLSYGGVAFEIKNGIVNEDYQVYTNPDTGKYAGCPGSCVKVTPTPIPAALFFVAPALFGVFGVSRRKNTAGMAS